MKTTLPYITFLLFTISSLSNVFGQSEHFIPQWDILDERFINKTVIDSLKLKKIEISKYDAAHETKQDKQIFNFSAFGDLISYKSIRYDLVGFDYFLMYSYDDQSDLIGFSLFTQNDSINPVYIIKLKTKLSDHSRTKIIQEKTTSFTDDLKKYKTKLTFKYDSRGNLVSKETSRPLPILGNTNNYYKYDTNGNLIEVIFTDGEDYKRKESYTLDSNGRKTSVKYSTSGKNLCENQGKGERYSYNKCGEIDSVYIEDTFDTYLNI